MIPLTMLLPPRKEFALDPVAPLGIRPSALAVLGTQVIDFDSEIACMMKSLQTHPLLGAAVNPTAPAASTPVVTSAAVVPPPVAPREGRRSSVGGDRAQVIAAQFETSDPGDGDDDEYPESEVEYFEPVSGFDR